MHWGLVGKGKELDTETFPLALILGKECWGLL